MVAALLIASAAACSSKAPRADARMTKRRASSSPSSTTVGWGMPHLPALWCTACATSQLTTDMALLPGTWCCKNCLARHLLNSGNPLFDSTFLPRSMQLLFAPDFLTRRVFP